MESLFCSRINLIIRENNHASKTTCAIDQSGNLMGLAGYDTAIHALGTPKEHVHIEQQTIAQGGSATQ